MVKQLKGKQIIPHGLMHFSGRKSVGYLQISYRLCFKAWEYSRLLFQHLVNSGKINGIPIELKVGIISRINKERKIFKFQKFVKILLLAKFRLRNGWVRITLQYTSVAWIKKDFHFNKFPPYTWYDLMNKRRIKDYFNLLICYEQHKQKGKWKWKKHSEEKEL